MSLRPTRAARLYSAGVVSQITEGTAFDKHGRPFRRRNFVPAAVMFAVLFLAAGAVWVIALNRPADTDEVLACNPPPPPTEAGQPALGSQVSVETMTQVQPARLADARVRVLNASGQGGQAATVADSLRDLGFAAPTAANDPIYTGTRLTCLGQIRFGPTGRAAAAALWVVAPCAELFEDQRPDDGVDLALGTEFSELADGDQVSAMLASLRPEATTGPDLGLLEELHTAKC